MRQTSTAGVLGFVVACVAALLTVFAADAETDFATGSPIRQASEDPLGEHGPCAMVSRVFALLNRMANVTSMQPNEECCRMAGPK